MKSNSKKKIIDNNMTNEINFNVKLNLDKIKYLYSLPVEELADTKEKQIQRQNILAEYIANGSSTVKINYIKKSNNRFYNSIQYLKGDIRNFILQDCYDYDLKSSTYSVMLYLSKKNKLPYDYIEYFVNNKDMLYEKYELLEINKDYMNSKCNQDNPYQCKVEEINNIINQFNSNKKKLITIYKDLINDNLDDKKNPISSQYCHIYFYFEAKIILETISHLDRDKIMTYMFDGFNSSQEISVDKLNKITKSYGVKWSIKPMPTKFVLGNIDNDLVEKKLNDYVVCKNKKYMTNLYSDFYQKEYKNAYVIADNATKYLKHTIKYCGGCWYVLEDNNLWSTDTKKKPLPYITKILRRGLTNSQNKLYKQKQELLLDDTKTRKYLDDELSELDVGFLNIDKSSMSKQITENLTKFLLDDDFHLKLDKNVFKLAFTNGIYDLRTQTFTYGIYPSDYLTKTLDFPYDKNLNINDNDIKWIKDELFKICNCNQQHLEYLLSILGYALTGDSEKYQEFYLCVGQYAGNGKSAIFETLGECFPQYVQKVDSRLIDADFKNKHKFVPKLGECRIAYMNEMGEKAKICGKTFKEIGDGKPINNEVLFSTSSNVPCNAKAFLLSNYTPVFDKLDEGVLRRYRHLQFDSEFDTKGKYKKDNPSTQKFVADLDFTKKLFAKKDSLLYILMDYANKVIIGGMPKPPNDFDKEKETIAESNLGMQNYVEDMIVNTGDDKDRLTKEEIIERLKQKFNKVPNVQGIMDIMKKLRLHTCYNKAKRKNGCRGIYVGLKIVEPEDDEDEDEDEINILPSDEEDTSTSENVILEVNEDTSTSENVLLRYSAESSDDESSTSDDEGIRLISNKMVNSPEYKQFLENRKKR